MAVVVINLDQFENPETNVWIKSLISLSLDFFKSKKIHRNYLLLEESESLPLKDSVAMLSEASSVDFKYSQTIIPTQTIEGLAKDMDDYYGDTPEPEYNYEG